MSSVLPISEIEYPSEDGQPMAETPLHVEAIVLLYHALQDYFAARNDVFVAADIFWYWEEGNVKARISPDVMVATGVPDRPLIERSSFRSWEENGVIPAVVFEIASKNTWREDIREKYSRYEELGVQEYFLFDPQGRYLVPVLQGFRLQGSTYRRLLDDDDALESELGFRLQPEGPMLRLTDLRSNTPILTRAEAVQQARLQAREAEIRLRDEQAKVEAERRKAEAERNRANELQAELDRLRQRAGIQGSGGGS